ncbi:hypothetical protein RJ640_003240 [Escallonia rubra]|uniref:Uncharacterized protein n=1 Tax=Escallonia rubra TaxID=112253 RepID=A0AA88RAS1_9ASTE|nr:hypothetical protein RJ640_003240 [Escallonia rubra]
MAAPSAMAMKIEILAEDIIKPSSPTPHHLRNFQFSLLDQLVPSIYTPLLLFYPGPTCTNLDHPPKSNPSSRSLQLKTSLSKLLVPFYPFAGRINGNASIECNDDGVPFLEARIKCSLLDLLKKPEAETMRTFLPVQVESKESSTIPLLIRVSFFSCGGMAIGICASHKITDASTLSTFINGWASESSVCDKTPVAPEFVISSLFPPCDSLTTLAIELIPENDCVTRRFVFGASSIATLKNKAEKDNAVQPTRVEAVSTLLWKCATAAASNKRPSVMTQIVNMRKRFIPALAENSVGNFSGYFLVENNGNEMELHSLVGKLKRGMKEFCGDYVTKLQGKEGSETIKESFKESGKMFMRDDIELYNFSSWCGFRLYDADFGWGKPAWVSIASWPYKNVVVLMDTKEGDGIEAWVNLKEEEMLVLERDPELLAFACPNPIVLSS